MIGKTISHFKILEKLGEGGMGIVYKAQDTKLKRTVALKFIPPNLTKDPETKKRFIHEAKVASSLDHTNICIIHEINETVNGQDYIVMACYEGETLKEKITRSQIEIQEAIEIAFQIANGLGKAHSKGVVHRDVKPANIFLTDEGVVKVLDFGLARLSDHTLMTREGVTLGTIAYMSPEQTRGAKVDLRTDIWAWGVVFYQMLTGELPFKGDYDQAVIYSILNEEYTPLEKQRKNIPEGIVGITSKALVKNADDRYQNMNEVIADLKACQVLLDDEKSIGGEKTKKKIHLKKILLPNVGILFFFLIMAGLLIFKPFRKPLPPWLRKNMKPSELGGEIGRVSPDGHYMAFGLGKVRIKDVQKGNSELLAPSVPGTQAQPAWSPDGTQIAFLTKRDPEAELIVCSFMGEINHRQNVYADTDFLSWSPDGMFLSWISYYSDSTVLWMYKPDDKTKRRICLNKNDRRFYYPAWSPDSRCMALEQRDLNRKDQGSIHILDVEKEIFSDSIKGIMAYIGRWWEGEGGMAWSPDGRYLVYAGYMMNGLEPDTEYVELFALRMKGMKVSGSPVPVTGYYSSNSRPGSPHFSRDGNRLYYGILESNHDLYVIPIDVQKMELSGKIIPIATSRKDDHSPVWTKDGQKVMFCSNRDRHDDLYLVDVKTPENLKRLTFTQEEEINPQISPDSNTISFFSKGRIYKMPIDVGEIIPLTPETVRLRSDYTWAPDGRSLYVMFYDSSSDKRYTLARMELDSGVFKPIAKTKPGRGISLSGDGRYMVVSNYEYVKEKDYYFEKISLIDVRSGENKDLAVHALLMYFGNLSWTPDGKYIVYDWMDPIKNQSHYELLPAKGGKPISLHIELGLLGNVLLYGIDPTGKLMLVSSEKNEGMMKVLGE